MILDKVISYLQQAFQSTNYFEKVFSLCEIIYQEKEQKPAAYTKQGQYEDIDIDHFNGVAYFRKDGDITTANYEAELLKNSCSTFVKIAIPIKAMIAVKKEKLTADDEFSCDRIAQSLIAVLSSKSLALRNALQAQNVSVFCPKYCTEAKKILNAEYGSKVFAINYNLAYLSLDLKIEIIIDKSCIDKECPTP